MWGPPGTGKTMLARRLPTIVAPLEQDEALEVTRIHSAVGGFELAAGLVRRPPFRAPHHGASSAALVGGGPGPQPGELTRAHRGVLFLDELGEFSRVALEALRQPLEDGEVIVVRAAGRARFPAGAQLVAAMNPCPCGGARECVCSSEQLDRYRARLSGPLLDRIDLVVRVAAPDPSDMRRDRPERSTEVRARVVVARTAQLRREQSGANARQSLNDLERIGIAPEASDLLERAASRLGLSGRAQVRALRVARTVADLGGRAQIEHDDLAEALAFHPRNGVVG
jgi:magnesium chelatase family protein